VENTTPLHSCRLTPVPTTAWRDVGHRAIGHLPDTSLTLVDRILANNQGFVVSNAHRVQAVGKAEQSLPDLSIVY
jgi:hypothetical protein